MADIEFGAGISKRSFMKFGIVSSKRSRSLLVPDSVKFWTIWITSFFNQLKFFLKVLSKDSMYNFCVSGLSVVSFVSFFANLGISSDCFAVALSKEEPKVFMDGILRRVCPPAFCIPFGF